MIEHMFDCAICGREVRDYFHRNGRDRQIAPVCRYCETTYSNRAPAAGNFMDRRKASQISALANALVGAANMKTWEARHGRA